MLKHCFFGEFQLIEGYVHRALKMELFITPFVERFKKLLWESLSVLGTIVVCIAFLLDLC